EPEPTSNWIKPTGQRHDDPPSSRKNPSEKLTQKLDHFRYVTSAGPPGVARRYFPLRAKNGVPFRRDHVEEAGLGREGHFTKDDMPVGIVEIDAHERHAVR